MPNLKKIKKCEISIVIPLLNEEGNLRELYKKLIDVLDGKLEVSYELIFVDDGSKDDSWKIIKELHKENKNVIGIKFSRNFGHQYALLAGLERSKGKAVISMDADLQHPPEIISVLYNNWKWKGYRIVQTIRKDTENVSRIKKITSKMYYNFLSKISDINIKEGISDFRLLDRSVVIEIIKIKDRNTFVRGLIDWIGFDKCYVEYFAPKRLSGNTKYTLKKMVEFALNGVLSFSIKPLRISMIFGLLTSSIAFIYLIYALYAKFILNIALPGWASIIVSLMFLGGAQLISLGIIGEYLGRMFIESKNRMNCVVEESIGEN